VNFFKKIILHQRFKKKKFAFLGRSVDVRQYNSHFLYPQNISIGDFAKIQDYAFFDGVGGITLGECSIVGPHVTVLTSNHNYHEKHTTLLPFDNIMIKKTVIIGNYCWIGRGVTILPGVSIGKACVVGAGSVVSKNVDDYTVVGGNPASCIRQRNHKLIDKLISSGRCVANWQVNQNHRKVFIDG